MACKLILIIVIYMYNMIDKRKNLRTNFQETHVHGSNFLAKVLKIYIYIYIVRESKIRE